MKPLFYEKAWEDYLDWQINDRKISGKINALIVDIQRNGLMKGIGHPEKLKHRPEYSRHINDEHRLVYIQDEYGNLFIISCKGHYIN